MKNESQKEKEKYFPRYNYVDKLLTLNLCVWYEWWKMKVAYIDSNQW